MTNSASHPSHAHNPRAMPRAPTPEASMEASLTSQHSGYSLALLVCLAGRERKYIYSIRRCGVRPTRSDRTIAGACAPSIARG